MREIGGGRPRRAGQAGPCDFWCSVERSSSATRWRPRRCARGHDVVCAARGESGSVPGRRDAGEGRPRRRGRARAAGRGALRRRGRRGPAVLPVGDAGTAPFADTARPLDVRVDGQRVRGQRDPRPDTGDRPARPGPEAARHPRGDDGAPARTAWPLYGGIKVAERERRARGDGRARVRRAARADHRIVGPQRPVRLLAGPVRPRRPGARAGRAGPADAVPRRARPGPVDRGRRGEGPRRHLRRHRPAPAADRADRRDRRRGRRGRGAGGGHVRAAARRRGQAVVRARARCRCGCRPTTTG